MWPAKRIKLTRPINILSAANVYVPIRISTHQGSLIQRTHELTNLAAMRQKIRKLTWLGICINERPAAMQDMQALWKWSRWSEQREKGLRKRIELLSRLYKKHAVKYINNINQGLKNTNILEQRNKNRELISEFQNIHEKQLVNYPNSCYNPDSCYNPNYVFSEALIRQ